MKLSKNSVYCYIIEPTRIRVACGDTYKIYNLKSHMEINLKEECDVYKVINEISYNTTSDTSFEIIRPYSGLHLTTYNNFNKSWTYNISTIDKYEIIVLKTKELIEKTERENRKKNEKSSIKTFFEKIGNGFGNSFNDTLREIWDILIYFFLFLLCVFVLIHCTRNGHMSN